MKQPIWLVVALLLTPLIAPTATAAIISRDLREPGDGLLTYDTQSGREWLDILQLESTPVDELPDLLAESGEYAGFRLASVADVTSLAVSSGLKKLGFRIPGDEDFDVANNFVQLLSGRFQSISSLFDPGWVTNGIVSDQLTETDCQVVMAWAIPVEVIPGALNEPLYARKPWGLIGTFRSSYGSYPTNPTLGYWLYRETAVPEPSVIALTLVVALLAQTRRTRQSF